MTNNILIHNEFYYRRPLYPFSLATIINEGNLCSDYQFKEVILNSSEDLFNSLNQKKIKEQQKLSLFKYKNRSSNRTTPYGLTAGIGIGKFKDVENFVVNNKMKKSLSPDMEWIFELIKLCEKELWKNLNLILNNSLIVKNKSIDVFWNSALSPLEKINSDSTILKTEPLNLIIKYCENKYITVEELIKNLNQIYPNVSLKTVDLYIKQLYENEVLISDLRLNLLTSNYYDMLLLLLKDKYNLNKSLTDRLYKIKHLIHEYNMSDSKNGLIIYKDILHEMENIVKSKNYLKVDTYFDDSIRFPNVQKGEIQDVIKLLLSFDPGKTITRNKFYLKFVDNYYHQSVSLLEVINNPNLNLSDYFESKREINKVLNDVLSSVNSQKNKVKKIKTEHLELLKNHIQNKNIQGELGVFVISENNNYKYIISPFVGSDKVLQGLGRFKDVKIEIDKSVSKDMLEVEVTFIPKKARLANIVNSSSCADYYFELSTQTINDYKKIPLEDIEVRATDDGFKFYSNKYQKELKFKKNNKLNHKLLPEVLRFLIEATETDYTVPNGYSMIIGYFNNSLYIPRIEYGNTILTCESWKLDPVKFNTVISFDLFKNQLEEYIKSNNIPTLLFMQEYDTRLLLDLTKEKEIKILYETWVKNKNVILVENIFNYDNLILSDDLGQKYLGEFIFQFSVPEIIEHNNLSYDVFNSTQNKIYNPFDKWLYLNIHINKKWINYLLLDCLDKDMNNLIKDHLIEDYFYILYFQDHDELRLRLKLCHEKKADLLLILLNLMKQYVENDYIYSYTFCPYVPEIARYGGINIFDSIEQFFCDDSRLCIKLIKLSKTGKMSLFDIAAVSITKLLYDIGLTNQQILNLYGYINVKDYRTEFIQYRKKLVSLINKKESWEGLRETDLGYELYLILEERKQWLIPIYNEIKKMNKQEFLTNNVETIILSLIHMHCNRIFGVNIENERKLMAFIRHSIYSIDKMLENQKKGQYEN